MSAITIEINRLIFRGPKVEPCSVEFGPGLNVFYGPTETGKSFIIEAIDFMLGGKELRQIPEKDDYDTILLWISLSDQRQFTLQRSTDGGGFFWLDGHHNRLNQEQASSLSAIHSSKTDANLSRKLLGLLGLDSKQVALSKDDVRGLSFRDLVHLVMIDEDGIWSKLSPVLSGNNVETTPRKSVFRLALTGIDASSLVMVKEARVKAVPLERQKDALSSLILKYAERTSQSDEESTRRRFSDLEGRLKELGDNAESEERQYNNVLREGRRYSESQEAAGARYRRLKLLSSRFDLLGQHYRSDLERLEAIAQAGSIFNAIHGGNCPVCGAAPGHHMKDAACNFDTEPLLVAVEAEVARIKGLMGGLSESIAALHGDMDDAQKREKEYEIARDSAQKRATELAPVVRERRRGVLALNNELSSLRQIVAKFDVADAFKKQVDELEADIKAVSPPEDAVDISLSPAASSAFAAAVEATLVAWGVPEVERVVWDSPKFDLQIGQRRRGDRGKGIRAITCAGFILTLMVLCREKKNPHPGFVVLDSPLLAYWEPDDDDYDLSQTDVNERFYKWLTSPSCAGQVIVVDNRPPPSWLAASARVVHFTKGKAGRYGLFPPKAPAA